MTKPRVYDYREKSCGMIPEMEELLRQADVDVVEFLVQENKLPQIINALATSDRWGVDVERELSTARVRFTRNNNEPGSVLDII
ncbi:MAG: hypothetical protein ACNI3A_13085 [Desulfovibrio sp.]|uniref:hypothetical protein n=1 Tax=Desulfovibrio sp. 7SRBS1 TaxID=3378064 RepID=UPI003B3D6AF8